MPRQPRQKLKRKNAATEPPAAVRVRGSAELRAALAPLLEDSVHRDACRAAAAGTARALEAGVLDCVWRELEGPLGLPPLPAVADPASS